MQTVQKGRENAEKIHQQILKTMIELTGKKLKTDFKAIGIIIIAFNEQGDTEFLGGGRVSFERAIEHLKRNILVHEYGFSQGEAGLEP